MESMAFGNSHFLAYVIIDENFIGIKIAIHAAVFVYNL